MEHKAEVLRYGDRFLARIDLTRLPKMSKSIKRKWIKQIERAQRVHKKEREQGYRGQRVITQYFQLRPGAGEQDDLGRDPG